MADFNFRINQLDDRSEVAKRIMGNTPQGLTTSASKRTNGDPRDITLFTMSQVLMGEPALKDQREILATVQQKVLGGLTSLVSSLGDIPGLDGLVPDFLQDLVNGADANPKFSIKDAQGNVPPFSGSDFPNGTQSFINKVSSLAKGEVGYSEEPAGSNRQKFSKNTGAADGIPWAMIFIKSIFKDAEIPQMGLIVDDVQNSFDSGWSVDRTGDVPLVGAIAFFNFSGAIGPKESAGGLARSGVGVDHAGIVVAVEKDIIRTVEGDASDATGGTQKGIWVKEKRRNKKDVVGYLYPVYPDGEAIAYPPTPEEEGQDQTPQPGDGLGSGGIGTGTYSFHNWEAATYDSKGPMPGATALLNYLMETFPGTFSLGIYNYRRVRGGSSLSIHSEGRAIDLGVQVNDEGKRLGDSVFRLIAPNAIELGIQAIAWYERWWSASSPDSRGHNNHFDHLHIELTRNAGANLTREKIEAAVTTQTFSPVAGGGFLE